MGMFKKRVRVGNPKDPARFFEEDFWIDTGAMYTFIPETRLAQIGIEPLDRRHLILAAGRTDSRLFGVADIGIEGLKGPIPCPVIFAPEDALFLLGATALENFGVDADPVSKTLKPVLSVIGGFLASK